MKFYASLMCFVMSLASSAAAHVSVTSPVSGSTLTSPIHYVATASTNTCSRGVASMGIYVNNSLTYVVNGTKLNTTLFLGPGKYNTVVEEWDHCGGATFTRIALNVTSKTGVFVSSPANNSSVSSPVHFQASAGTSACAKGVASMGVYVDNQLVYVVNGAHLNTNLNMSPGAHRTVVEEWDFCGGAAFTPVDVKVGGGGSGGSRLVNLQASGGWRGYGELPPVYNICTTCSPQVSYSMNQGVTSPSLSGRATRFNLGGTLPYSDVLWTNAVIGQNSTQGLPDVNHILVPAVHNFTYDADFFTASLAITQVLEFDINQYFNGMSFIWGTQCRVAGGHEWDIWDNINNAWVSTGVPCNPNNNAWNHVTVQVQRTWDNRLFYQSITLNGVTHAINRYYSPGSVPGTWWGITINYQMDGNFQQAPYSVFVDNLNLSYF